MSESLANTMRRVDASDAGQFKSFNLGKRNGLV